MISILKEFFQRMKWSYRADRLGPDMFSTYFLMYSPKLATKICKKKFKTFGSKAEVRHGAVIIGCSKIELGEFVVIRPGAYLVAGDAEIIIEDKVLIASGVQIHTENHSFADTSIPIFDQGFEKGENIRIQKGAWIGANSVILPGVNIGENAVVAAGNVVNRDVLDFTVVAGVPAKPIKKMKVD